MHLRLPQARTRARITCTYRRSHVYTRLTCTREREKLRFWQARVSGCVQLRRTLHVIKRLRYFARSRLQKRYKNIIISCHYVSTACFTALSKNHREKDRLVSGRRWIISLISRIHICARTSRTPLSFPLSLRVCVYVLINAWTRRNVAWRGRV